MSNVHSFPQTKPRLHCSVCGIGTDAKCDCGAPYVAAGKAAEEAVKKNPEMSNRAIAEKIGVSTMTVGRARKSTGTNVTVEKTVGRDGRKRKVRKVSTPPTPETPSAPPPTSPPKKTAAFKAKLKSEASDYIRELVEFTADYARRVTAWHKANPDLDVHDKTALMRTIHQCADTVLGLAQAIDGR